MIDNAIVQGEFVTYSHLKTRKTFSIVIEFPEEQALHVLNTLGSPIGGNSKPVAVALLNSEIDRVSYSPGETREQTQGEKLRTRAVLLCKDRDFQIFLESFDRNIIIFNENAARTFLIDYCNISSRSELTIKIEAQNKFKELLEKYKDWQVEQQYADNLERM